MTNGILTLDSLTQEVYVLGSLDLSMIQFLGLSRTEATILLGRDRVKYFEKHKVDFSSEDAYRRHIEAVPSILQSPEFAGVHPDGASIRLVKKVEQNMLIAVRLTASDRLWVRSAYPITEDKLSYYLKTGQLRRYATS